MRFTKVGALIKDAGADVERLGRDAQGFGQGLQDLGTGLLQAALDLRDVRVADPRHLGQLTQRELRRLALLSQVLAKIVNGDRGELRHDSIMLTPVSTMQALASIEFQCHRPGAGLTRKGDRGQAVRRSLIDNSARAWSVVKGGRCINRARLAARDTSSSLC